MVAIRLNAIVGKDRKLTIQLPEDAPTGEVELIIQVTEQKSGEMTREEVRAKLLAAGALVTDFPPLDEDVAELSPEELLQNGTLPPDARSSLDLINEDLGEW